VDGVRLNALSRVPLAFYSLCKAIAYVMESLLMLLKEAASCLLVAQGKHSHERGVCLAMSVQCLSLP
jgi:hypothetical protein